VDALLQLVRDLTRLFLRQLREHLRDVLVAVEDLEDVLLDLRVAELVVQHVLELPAEREATPTEVGLEDLTDVHAARNAERVEHDVDRPAVLRVRHVLFGHDARDDTLVAVASGHLVADLELALDGDVDLHHLDDARRKLVALREAIDLVAEVLLADADDLLELGELRGDVLDVVDRELAPVLVRDLVERRLVDRLALLEKDLALVVDELAVVV
jgi:hypothetical protein